MTPNLQQGRQHSVARQLLTRVLAVYFAVALLLLAVDVAVQYYSVKQELSEELRLIHQSFGPGLAQALWDINTEQVQSFYDGIRELPSVVGVEISDENGNRVCAGGNLLDEGGNPVFVGPDGKRTPTDEYAEMFSYGAEIRFGPADETQKVGAVTIYSSSGVVFQKLKLGIGLTVLQVTVAAAALGLIFLLLFRRYLGRPLRELSSAVEQLDLGRIEDFRVDAGPGARGELKVLEESFNRMADGLARDRRDLGERMKELSCLYGISELTEQPDISMEELFRQAVDLLPQGWHYPEITCARLRLDDRASESAGFQETQWRQAREIRAAEEVVGRAEVFYKEEMPELDEGPFLAEERNLINAIADRLGAAVEGHRAAVALREYQQQLELQVEDRTADLARLTEQGQSQVREESTLAALTAGLQGDLSAAEVAERGLQAIVDFLQAASGTLYVLEDDGRLYRRAAYALPPEAETFSSVALGMSSVGEAARSREMAASTPPDRAWHLAFGAGPARPTQVVTLPLVAGHAVTGVVEVGLLAELDDARERWLSKAGEITATALRFAGERGERQRSEERVRLILESTGDGLFGLDDGGLATFANPAACEILGYAADEIIGQPVHETVHHSRPDGTPLARQDCRMGDAIREGAHVHVDDEVLWHQDGHAIPVEYRARPIMKEDRVVGAVVSFQDVTERRAAERALGEANERLQARIPIALLGSEVGEALIGDAPLRERLQACAEAFASHVDVAFARIWTVNDAGDTLELQASAGLYTHIDGARARVTIGKKKIGLIAQAGTPYINDGNLPEDPRLDEPDWPGRTG